MIRDSQDILEPEELRLLASIGFMAAHTGNGRNCTDIFDGLRILRPASSLPAIGIALSRMGNGAYTDAVRVLQEERLRAPSESDELDVFLGMALSLAQRRAEAHRVLKNMLARSGSPSPERELAAKLLAGSATGAASSLTELASSANRAIRQHTIL
jgi:hypothetical protein